MHLSLKGRLTLLQLCQISYIEKDLLTVYSRQTYKWQCLLYCWEPCPVRRVASAVQAVDELSTRGMRIAGLLRIPMRPFAHTIGTHDRLHVCEKDDASLDARISWHAQIWHSNYIHLPPLEEVHFSQSQFAKSRDIINTRSAPQVVIALSICGFCW